MPLQEVPPLRLTEVNAELRVSGKSLAQTFTYAVLDSENKLSDWLGYPKNETGTNLNPPIQYAADYITDTSAEIYYSDNSAYETRIYIQISTNSSFSTLVTSRYVNADSFYEPFIGVFNESTTYYSRLRNERVTTGATYYSGWSNVVSFTTAEELRAPILTGNPTQIVNPQETSLSFQGMEATYATFYDIEVIDDGYGGRFEERFYAPLTVPEIFTGLEDCRFYLCSWRAGNSVGLTQWVEFTSGHYANDNFGFTKIRKMQNITITKAGYRNGNLLLRFNWGNQSTRPNAIYDIEITDIDTGLTIYDARDSISGEYSSLKYSTHPLPITVEVPCVEGQKYNFKFTASTDFEISNSSGKRTLVSDDVEFLGYQL